MDSKHLFNFSQDLPDTSYFFVGDNSKVDLQTNKQICCQVTVLWGKNIIHQSKLVSQSFYVGETNNCNYILPSEKLGNIQTPIVIFKEDTFYAVSDQQHIPLSAGESFQVVLSEFTFQISVDHQVKPVGGKNIFNKIAGMFTGLSTVLHATLLGSVAYLMPDFDVDNTDISVEQQLLMSQYLASASEKEQKLIENQIENAVSGGDTGTASKGSSGSMGNINSTSKGRYGIAGPKDNVDKHISREKALAEANNFGLVGLLSSTLSGDMNAPTAPWGRDTSLGNDPISATGSMWADTIGEGFGSGGLGLTGIGEGSDGPGEGIGLGRVNTIGSNLTPGFGPNGKLKGSRKQNSIQMRAGNTTSSGRIPPEVIQRVIRQNFGSFRLCYENGLRNNPSLSGRVSVRFVIDRNGAATQASNAGSDLPDSGVTSCVVRGFNGLSFPAPESGIVTVSYSIQFSPG